MTVLIILQGMEGKGTHDAHEGKEVNPTIGECNGRTEEHGHQQATEEEIPVCNEKFTERAFVRGRFFPARKKVFFSRVFFHFLEKKDLFSSRA